MNNEKVEKVLGFDIKVLTNKGKEKIIRFTDIQGHIGSSLSIDNGYYYNMGEKHIELKLDCFGYSMEFVEVDNG